MGNITDGINGFFFLSLGTIFVGFCHYIIQYCYKSKCKECSCCCFKIIRDIDTKKQKIYYQIIKQKMKKYNSKVYI